MKNLALFCVVALAAVPPSWSVQPQFDTAFSRRGALGALGVVAASVGGARAARAVAQGLPLRGDESLMAPKAHGTTEAPVQEGLRFAVDRRTADRICSFNRDYAERAGYFTTTSFARELEAAGGPMTFYDSVTGRPLFVAPKGRSVEEFLAESQVHGWPSFRDQEVVWDNVRVLRNGETVSVDGTHLGHDLPDRSGNRYCINLVSIAGNPV